MIGHWLAAPVTTTILTVVGTLSLTCAILVFLSYGAPTARRARTFQGVVPPFLGVSTVILGILIGFLASDIWDRDRRAAAAVKSEADGLVTLFTLASTFERPDDDLAVTIRAYVDAVTTKEWLAMNDGREAPQAEERLDDLLRATVRLVKTPGSNATLDRTLIDTAMAIRASRDTRLTLSRDESGPFRWIAVIVLAVLSQVSIAAVHLEKLRPQILALAIHTTGLVFVIGLLAAHEVPFMQPFAISPAPIAQVLDIVPAPSALAK